MKGGWWLGGGYDLDVKPIESLERDIAPSAAESGRRFLGPPKGEIRGGNLVGVPLCGQRELRRPLEILNVDQSLFQ